MKQASLFRKITVLLLGIVACGAAAYLVFLFVVGQAIKSLDTGNLCPPFDPSAVEAKGFFKLPPSAHNLSSQCSGWNAWSAEARFQMKPTDLSVLIAYSIIKKPMSSSGRPATFPTLDQATSNKIGSYFYGEDEEGEVFQQILIDTTDPNEYTVYVRTLAG